MMHSDKSLMTVADAAGVVGEAPPGFVQLNGITYRLPPNFSPEKATEIVMIEVDTRNLSRVHVPQFRLEAHLGMAPKLYSQFQDVTLKAGWDDYGNAAMGVNPFSLEDSHEVLTLAKTDVVIDGSTKLKQFKKPASFLGRVAAPKAKAKVKAKAKAKGKVDDLGKSKGKGKR